VTICVRRSLAAASSASRCSSLCCADAGATAGTAAGEAEATGAEATGAGAGAGSEAGAGAAGGGGLGCDCEVSGGGAWGGMVKDGAAGSCTMYADILLLSPRACACRKREAPQTNERQETGDQRFRHSKRGAERSESAYIFWFGAPVGSLLAARATIAGLQETNR
jgi:hypothetical protein